MSDDDGIELRDLMTPFERAKFRAELAAKVAAGLTGTGIRSCGDVANVAVEIADRILAKCDLGE